MKVSLLHATPLSNTDIAIGKCWDKQKEEVDYERIERVGNKNRHSSTLEHVVYTFDVDGISRAVLQELARHRMASLSVKSTRYTLKELKDAPDSSLKDFIVSVNAEVDAQNIMALRYLSVLLKQGMSNDKAKYCLPEAFKTSLVWTINLRSLQNFLTLRTGKQALWEIRELAYEVYKQVPDTHKYLIEESMIWEK